VNLRGGQGVLGVEIGGNVFPFGGLAGCFDQKQIFYGEFDGRRRKRVLVKIIGE